jgi:hypothetical protein
LVQAVNVKDHTGEEYNFVEAWALFIAVIICDTPAQNLTATKSSYRGPGNRPIPDLAYTVLPGPSFISIKEWIYFHFSLKYPRIIYFPFTLFYFILFYLQVQVYV